jgi:5-methylcytosine-specific restriction endonuclease McrA
VRNPRLRAAFFVTPDGVAIPKARPVPERLRLEIMERDGWHCRECGKRVRRFRRGGTWLRSDPVAHVDHVFPRARGGQTTPDNLRLTCESCNEAKAAD